jgi:UPF0755 protein
VTPEYPPKSSWQIRMIQVFVVILIIVVGFVAVTSLARKLASGISNESTGTVAIEQGLEVEFQVEPGATAKQIAAALADAGIIADAGDFENAVTAAAAGNQLKAGTYTLVTGTDYSALIDTLVAGPDTVPVMRVTVIEGLTIDETLASLAAQTPYTVAQLSAPLLDGTVDSPYLPDKAPDGSPELTRWEGLLAPDTYEFRQDASAADIVGKLVDTLTARVAATDWSELADMGLKPYDGLIIASLIEKEAKLDSERATIASVITNRLKIDMALQVDATIIYALGENHGEVTTKDLEVESPYNTYLHTGLPPTPIAGVRPASIQAAAHPESTNYFYYVLINKDGTHGFSETLEEHNRLKEQAKQAGVLTP